MDSTPTGGIYNSGIISTSQSCLKMDSTPTYHFSTFFIVKKCRNPALKWIALLPYAYKLENKIFISRNPALKWIALLPYAYKLENKIFISRNPALKWIALLQL